MRAALPAFALALCLVATACGGGDKGTTAPDPNAKLTTVDVYTPGNTFSPFRTEIPAGATVRFNIFGVPHNVVFDSRVAGRPLDIPVRSNAIVSRTFNTRGTFPYDCTVHPGMSGEVVVK